MAAMISEGIAGTRRDSVQVRGPTVPIEVTSPDAPVGEAVLCASNVGFAGAARLHRGISISLRKHQAAWIRGSDRIARSRLLRILCGIECPIEGEIHWKGMRIARAARSMHAELAFLDRSAGLSEMLTPLENLELYLRIRGCCARIDPEQALSRVGLSSLSSQPVGRLGIQQRRRVAIARMLVTRATAWAIDESAQAIDDAELELLRDLVNEHLEGRGVLLFAGDQRLAHSTRDLVTIGLED
jgi:heme exporter protein A